jgi:hypothetical protein
MLGAILLLLAQAEAVPAPPAELPATVETKSADSCEEAEKPNADTRAIIVCAQRPNGYRLNPDVMAAKRVKRGGRGASPKPHENFKQDECATVGPMGCRGQGVIDIPSAAIAAVQMVAKAVKGENVGAMFKTDNQLSEYELYLLAKADREGREEEVAASKVRAEARAKDQANATPTPAKPVSVADEKGPGQ